MSEWALTQEAKQFNRRLATQRVGIEHIVRWCKIFRITKDIYRGKHRNYGKTWNMIAAIVNLKALLAKLPNSVVILISKITVTT